jgi:fucose permease
VSRIRHRPNLDRPTVLSYVQIGYYTWLNYGFGASQALLRDDQGTTKTLAALHGTFFALGGLFGALVAPHLVRRFGRGMTMRIGALGLAAGIALFTVPSGPTVTWTAAFLAPFFGSFLLVGLNAFLLDHQGAAGPAALTQANAVGSFAGILAPFAIGAAAVTILGWRAGLWFLIAAIVVVEVLRGRNLGIYDGTPFGNRKAGRLPSAVWWSAAMLACFVGAEFCLLFWGPDMLRDRAGFGAAAAAAGVGVTSLGMFLGRLGGSRLAQSLPPRALLIGSTLIALASFAVFWSTRSGWLLLTTMFIIGLGLALLWPLGIAEVLRNSGGQTDRASSLAVVSAGIAIGSGPFILGAVADRTSVHLAFLIVPVLLLFAFAILLTAPLRQRNADASLQRQQ